MIKTLWFFTKIAVLTYGALWLLAQEGNIKLSFLNYDITTKTGLFFLGLIALFFMLYYLVRFLNALIRSPKSLATYQENRKEKVGYTKLTQGLAAVAAGDTVKATKMSNAVQKNFKGNENGLSILLQAQAARLRGEETLAQQHFETLLEDKNVAFLGLRGLMKSALDSKDYPTALNHAKKALKTYPKQSWLTELVYDLELKNGHWEEALKLGKKLENTHKNKIISDRIAIHLMRHDYDVKQQDAPKAFYNLKAAYKLNPSFTPTVIRYVEHLIGANKAKKAQKLILEAWANTPHPQLADLWGRLHADKSKNNDTKKLAFYQKLIETNPKAVESYIAVAKCAVNLGFWGEAKANLMSAQTLELNAEIIDLKHIVEKNMTHTEDSTWLENNGGITPAKQWTCLETGRCYDKWSAIAVPHNSFNTIEWDYPSAHVIDAPALQPPILLIDPQ